MLYNHYTSIYVKEQINASYLLKLNSCNTLVHNVIKCKSIGLFFKVRDGESHDGHDGAIGARERICQLYARWSKVLLSYS